MELKILTANSVLYSGMVKLVKLPGVNGSFEILKDHAPIISILEAGKIKIIDSEDSQQYFEISSGIVECKKNQIVVLSEGCTKIPAPTS